jgi:dolichol-phosphate mannosyltransferase
LTHGGHAVTKTFLRLPFDASGALRVYNLAAIPREAFGLVKATGYGFFFESLFILAKNRAKIQELPIVLPSRLAGHSKMNLREIVRGVSYLLFICGLSFLAPARFKLGAGIRTAEVDGARAVCKGQG